MSLAQVLALTERTPEASTVPSPIGKPGGPGLWHHKDLQLPPYIQHVAKHLMKDHDESRAIEMAVGIVRNWAHGHDGHGHKVHSDVQAAAAKNIAQWEADKAKAHSETAARHAGGKVAASSDLDEVLALASIASYIRSEHGRLERVGPYMRDIRQRISSQGPEILAPQYHILDAITGEHAEPHLAREIDHTAENMPFGALTPGGYGRASMVLHDAADAVRSGDHARARKLLHEAHGHASQALRDHPGRPGEAGVERIGFHLHALGDAPEFDHSQDIPIASRDSDELVRWKRENRLPVGAGPNRQGDTGAVHQRAGFSGALGQVVALAVAGQLPPYGQLQHAPSQTVSASPPLPPGTSLPSESDLRKLVPEIEGLGGSDLLTGSAKHATAAADKMGTGDYIGALSALRSAQTGIQAHARKVTADHLPVAYAFSASAATGEQGAARKAMADLNAQRGRARDVHQHVSARIDQIRRYHFHGHYGSIAQQSRFG